MPAFVSQAVRGERLTLFGLVSGPDSNSSFLICG